MLECVLSGVEKQSCGGRVRLSRRLDKERTAETGLVQTRGTCGKWATNVRERPRQGGSIFRMQDFGVCLVLKDLTSYAMKAMILAAVSDTYDLSLK